MHSNPDTIDIRDESIDGEARYRLYVDGTPKVTLVKKRGVVELRWEVYGPMRWQEARVLVQGLAELTVIADQLSTTPEPFKKRKKK